MRSETRSNPLRYSLMLWKLNCILSMRSGRGKGYVWLLNLGAAAVLFLFVCFALSMRDLHDSDPYASHMGMMFIILYSLLGLSSLSYRLGTYTAVLPHHLRLFPLHAFNRYGISLLSMMLDPGMLIFWIPAIPICIAAFLHSWTSGVFSIAHMCIVFVFLQTCMHMLFLLTIPLTGKHPEHFQSIPSFLFLGLLLLIHMEKIDVLFRLPILRALGSTFPSPADGPVFEHFIADGVISLLSILLWIPGSLLLHRNTRFDACCP